MITKKYPRHAEWVQSMQNTEKIQSEARLHPRSKKIKEQLKKAKEQEKKEQELKKEWQKKQIKEAYEQSKQQLAKEPDTTPIEKIKQEIKTANNKLIILRKERDELQKKLKENIKMRRYISNEKLPHLRNVKKKIKKSKLW